MRIQKSDWGGGAKLGYWGRTIKVSPPNKNIEMSKYADLIIFAFTLFFSPFYFIFFPFASFYLIFFPLPPFLLFFYLPLFAPQNLGWGTCPLCPPPWKRPCLHNCLVFCKHSQLNKHEYDKYYVRILMALLLNDKSLIGLTIETIKIKLWISCNCEIDFLLDK